MMRGTVARIVYAIRTSCHPPCKCDEYYTVYEENEDLLILAYEIPYRCSNCQVYVHTTLIAAPISKVESHIYRML